MKTFSFSAVFLVGLASSLAIPACRVESQTTEPGTAGSGEDPDDRDTCRVGTSSFTVPGDECSASEEDKDCPIAGGDDPCKYGPFLTCRGGEWKAETFYLNDCSKKRSCEVGKTVAGNDCQSWEQGTTCGETTGEPCGFGHSLVCQGGKWTDLESAPDPACQVTCDPKVTKEGDDCRSGEEGKQCGETSGDPCTFGHSLVCRLGTWQDQEAAPDPACQQVELDSEGCPVDNETAKGKKCTPPQAEDCNGAGSEFGMDCLDGVWTVTDIGEQPDGQGGDGAN